MASWGVLRRVLLASLLLCSNNARAAEPDLIVLESFAAPTVHLAAMSAVAMSLLSTGLVKIRIADDHLASDDGTIIAASAFLLLPPLASAATTFGIAETSHLRSPSFWWTLLAGLVANLAWIGTLYLADLPPSWALATPLWAGAAEVLVVNLLDQPRTAPSTAQESQANLHFAAWSF